MASAVSVECGLAFPAPEGVTAGCGIRIQLPSSLVNLYAPSAIEAHKWLERLKCASQTASDLSRLTRSRSHGTRHSVEDLLAEEVRHNAAAL